MSTYNKNRPQTIQSMFNSIAKRYDRTNAVLSFYLHKQWNCELVKRVQSQQTSHTLLDLCAGTGDIAFHYLQQMKTPCQAYLVDFSSEMLACAEEKAKYLSSTNHSIQYILADVQRLPLSNQTIDCATMAYGIRNIHHPLQALQETFRILKPGACLGILELTRPDNKFLRIGHQLYLKIVLPIVGKWLTANKDAYQYLRNSIHTFIPPQELEDLVKTAGFINTGRYPLAGGIATIITGFKPMING
jgi:demethylmenaquinone methyltransferase/2-methoxy-6-polyprenyl-1,4-benzoquinol methylase